MLGIRSPQFNQKYSINTRSLSAGSLIFITNIIAVIPQLHEVNNFVDYTYAIKNIATMGQSLFDFGIHIWIAATLFKFIENFQKIIEESE